MAITKIQCLNEAHTGNPAAHLKNALSYIQNPEKTEENVMVGSINCLPDTAFEQMMDTKVTFGKTNKRQGYHIIISFAPGEATEEQALDIVARFAQEYLKDKYEAVYAVHNDKKHMHGHIVFNSVSFETGMKHESNLFHVLRVGLPTICNTESENQELTFDKLFVYYASKGITLNKRTFKKNLGFLLDNGKYNMLAQLMSDNSGIPIRFAIFKGKDKTSTMYSVREFGNTCLLMSLDKVLEYGGVLNVPQADERERIVERKEIPLFDEEAFREAMINAFVHNQWTTGNAPMITAFSDRIEILSRGTIPPGQTMEGFFAGESVPVNQKLSDMLLQLHISERTGRGVPKITEVYGKGTYEFRENSIVVSIPFTRVSTEDEDPRWTQDRTQDRTQDGTQEDSKGSSEDEKIKRILEFCQTPKGILEITEMLGYSGRKPTKKYVKPLVEQGRLAMTIPDKPQSKNQKYVTVK